MWSPHGTNNVADFWKKIWPLVKCPLPSLFRNRKGWNGAPAARRRSCYAPRRRPGHCGVEDGMEITKHDWYLLLVEGFCVETSVVGIHLILKTYQNMDFTNTNLGVQTTSTVFGWFEKQPCEFVQSKWPEWCQRGFLNVCWQFTEMQ